MPYRNYRHWREGPRNATSKVNSPPFKPLVRNFVYRSTEPQFIEICMRAQTTMLDSEYRRVVITNNFFSCDITPITPVAVVENMTIDPSCTSRY